MANLAVEELLKKRDEIIDKQKQHWDACQEQINNFETAIKLISDKPEGERIDLDSSKRNPIRRRKT